MSLKKAFQGNVLGIAAIFTAISALGFSQRASIRLLQDGAPPQDGEHVVTNNSIDFGTQHFEIDGVCKFTSESALCWKPDGSPNESLTSALNSAIHNMSGPNARTWSFTFGKKRRMLVLKEVRSNYSGVTRYGSPFRQNQTNTFSEGWGQSSGNSNFSANATGFDGLSTNWTTIEGVFEKSTNEFPFRYVFQEASPGKTEVRPVKIGTMDIDGNVIDITAIGDHPKAPKSNNGINFSAWNGQPDMRIPLTDISFKVISLANPFSSVYLRLADENGKPIEFVDNKGNPVAQEEVNKWYQAHQVRQPGKPIPVNPYISAGGFSMDPFYSNVGQVSVTPFFIPKDKIKNLSITISKREVYVWDHVKLDPN